MVWQEIERLLECSAPVGLILSHDMDGGAVTKPHHPPPPALPEPSFIDVDGKRVDAKFPCSSYFFD